MLEKARRHAVAFPGHTLAEAGGACVSAQTSPADNVQTDWGRGVGGEAEHSRDTTKLTSGVYVLVEGAWSELKERIQKLQALVTWKIQRSCRLKSLGVPFPPRAAATN